MTPRSVAENACAVSAGDEHRFEADADAMAAIDNEKAEHHKRLTTFHASRHGLVGLPPGSNHNAAPPGSEVPEPEAQQP